MTPGENHHQVLAYLAGQLPDNSLVYDLGTYKGASALALASNAKIRVVTLDIFCSLDNGAVDVRSLENVQFIQQSCFDCLDKIATAQLVMLDISPHNGADERRFVEEMEKRGFKGILVVDDIKLSDAMQSFWNDVKQKKFDVTPIGHWSGTGIICFAPDVLDVIME